MKTLCVFLNFGGEQKLARAVCTEASGISCTVGTGYRQYGSAICKINMVSRVAAQVRVQHLRKTYVIVVTMVSSGT